MAEPSIVAETDSFLIVFKPRFMHSAPLSEGEEGTLLAWCAEVCPQVLSVSGKKNVERGLLHRLDRDTEGLVVLAKTQRAYDSLLASQERGEFLKTYEAISASAPPDRALPFVVESGFRPFGPGRRAVKAVALDAAGKPLSPRDREVALDRGQPYLTEVLAMDEVENGGRSFVRVRARLARGFRHQVRCHLSWIGLPLVGDALYGGESGFELGLSAVEVSFPDPESARLLSFEDPRTLENRGPCRS